VARDPVHQDAAADGPAQAHPLALTAVVHEPAVQPETDRARRVEPDQQVAAQADADVDVVGELADRLRDEQRAARLRADGAWRGPIRLCPQHLRRGARGEEERSSDQNCERRAHDRTPVSGLYGIGSTAGGGTGRADIRPTRAGAHMFRDGAEGGAQRHARTPRARPPRGSRAAASSDGATRWRPRLAPGVPALVTDRVAVRRDEVPLGAEPLD